MMDDMSHKKPERIDDDMLDRLLSESPPPEAPDWFEARLMARIRTEASPRSANRWLEWMTLTRVLGAGGVAVVLLLAVFTWDGGSGVTGEELSQAELNEALDALVSYQEESDQWSYDMF
jgi:hypothetical protein